MFLVSVIHGGGSVRDVMGGLVESYVQILKTYSVALFKINFGVLIAQ